MPSAAFTRFWRTDLTRDCFLSHTTQDDRQSLRLVCQDFGQHVAPFLFSHIDISFGTNTFTRLPRMMALERIGRHIKSVAFDMPHTADTFLAPLIDPVTGEEQTFIYEPQLALHRLSSSSSRSSLAKYGSSEMNDLLVKQYPPLFHAATNIPSFIRAFKAMPSLRHMKISCAGQPSNQRYRRNAVDYALISLRIAIEHATLDHLDTLSLEPIHPSAVLYLRPQLGMGASPASIRRWRQIKNLHMLMDTIPFGVDQRTDHIKLLHSYLQCFRPHLSTFTFRWNGPVKGPNPLCLPAEPCIVSSRCSFDSPTKACPKTSTNSPFPPLKFRNLKTMSLENALTDASQIASFILLHRKVLHEFSFEDIELRTGTWEEALAPLTRISGGEEWKQKVEEVMDVPLLLSPAGSRKQEPDCVVKEVMWDDDDDEHGRKKGIHALGRSSLRRTREMLGMVGREDLKRLLKSSLFTWR